ncbi:MAG: alpha/beta hydrolase [Deltaproteobacteria bacterium]|nr:MAG: alpha/beta hydrolase [Deltaproteobacteria bacterium]
MKPTLLVLATVLAFPFSSSLAQVPSPAPEIAAEVVRTDAYPTLQVVFPNDVEGLPGLVYQEPVGYRPLTLDLYLPAETVERPAEGFPLVVYIHGGGWMGGDARRSGAFVDFPGVLASLAARGYAVASVEYRLSGEAHFPAPIQDVKAAIRWLRSQASTYGIDPKRAITWGVSAGGHLAALAAVSCNAKALAPAQTMKSGAPDTRADNVSSSNVSDCIQGGVSWYGVFDLSTIAAQARKDKAMSRDVPDAPEWRLLGCFANKCKKSSIASASPVAYVDASDPPLLLIAGDADTTVPYHQTLDMAEKLRSAGVPYEVMVLPGINHGFVGKTPEATREANLRALDATFRFIDRVLKRAPAQ